MRREKGFVFPFLNHLWALALVLALLLAVLLGVALSPGEMARNFAAYTDYAHTGIEPGEYPAMAQRITAYIGGADVDMNAPLPLWGEERRPFTPEEMIHMEDVRGLFTLAKVLLAGLLGFCVLYLVIVTFKRLPAMPLVRAFRNMGVATFTVAAALGLWAALDFNSLFTLFHRLAFTNELWLLDPRTSVMINMMPTAFFVAYGGKILTIFLCVLAALTIAAGIITIKKFRKREAPCHE